MTQQNQVNVDIEEEESDEVTPRTNVLHRLDSRPSIPNRNNIGLGDRLNSVFREIRPLVENARMVKHYFFINFRYNVNVH